MAAVMIGVDPHKASHTAAAIGPAEEPLGGIQVRAAASQAEQLLAWRRRGRSGPSGWPFPRARRDFSERDRALLALLRPHLHRAYLDAERRRDPAPQLTPGSGSCCAWSPPGTPARRSPANSASAN